MYDVIVVGSGPAGSSAARVCAENGLNTLIIEKEKHPRDKPCGGAILNYVDIDQSLVKNKIEFFDIFFNYKKFTTITYPVYIVNRKEFDFWLVKKAKSCGAKLVEKEEVISVDVKESVHIKTNKGSYVAKMVIGADGPDRLVARNVGLHKKGIIYVTLVTDCKSNLKDNKSKLYFFDDMVGYFWIFPKKEMMNIGAGYCGPHKLDLMDRLFEFADKINIKLDKSKVKGAIIPGYLLPKIYGNKVLLAGDAAGFINPLTGGGIDLAIRSGSKAGAVAAKAIKQNDVSEKFLSQYKKECSSMIKKIKKGKRRFWILESLVKLRLIKPIISIIRLFQ